MDASASRVPASDIARASTCRRAVERSVGRAQCVRSVGSVGSVDDGSIGSIDDGSIGSIDRVDRVDRSGSRSIDRVGSSIGRGRARSIGSVHRSVGVALDRSGRSIASGRARSRRSIIDRVGPSSIAANLREGLVVESRPDGTPPRASCIIAKRRVGDTVRNRWNTARSTGRTDG